MYIRDAVLLLIDCDISCITCTKIEVRFSEFWPWFRAQITRRGLFAIASPQTNRVERKHANMPEIDAAALQNLDPESRKEIMQFVEAETSRSKVQSCKSWVIFMIYGVGVETPD